MQAELKGLFQRLAKLAEDNNLCDAADYAFGAVYALAMAQARGYQHRPGPLPAEYWSEVRRRCEHAAKGKFPRPGRWLGGFYFNSALMRIAATHDKIEAAIRYKKGGKNAPMPCGQGPKRHYDTTNLKAVRKEVSKLKHERKSTVGGRAVDPPQARAALTDLVEIMEKFGGR